MWDYRRWRNASATELLSEALEVGCVLWGYTSKERKYVPTLSHDFISLPLRLWCWDVRVHFSVEFLDFAAKISTFKPTPHGREEDSCAIWWYRYVLLSLLAGEQPYHLFSFYVRTVPCILLTDLNGSRKWKCLGRETHQRLRERKVGSSQRIKRTKRN